MTHQERFEYSFQRYYLKECEEVLQAYYVRYALEKLVDEPKMRSKASLIEWAGDIEIALLELIEKLDKPFFLRWFSGIPVATRALLELLGDFEKCFSNTPFEDISEKVQLIMEGAAGLRWLTSMKAKEACENVVSLRVILRKTLDPLILSFTEEMDFKLGGSSIPDASYRK